MLTALRKDPCFMAGYSLENAPHGPKCLCLLHNAVLSITRHFVGEIVPNMPRLPSGRSD
jgi:hypothetical protein